MRQAPLLHCMAAADAMAAGSTAGIGGRGRNSTATKFVWFSESCDMTEIRKFALQLTKETQAYILLRDSRTARAGQSRSGQTAIKTLQVRAPLSF